MWSLRPLLVFKLETGGSTDTRGKMSRWMLAQIRLEAEGANIVYRIHGDRESGSESER